MKIKGRGRDARVLTGLEERGYMTTLQVGETWFQAIKNPNQRLKKASERLKKMHNLGLLNRFRIPGEYFIYTCREGGYNHKVNHFLAINDVLLTLQKIKPAGSVLEYEIEKKKEDIIVDLYLRYRNEFRKEEKEYFIEVQLSPGDVVEKIKKYERLFRSLRREKESDRCLCLIGKKKALQSKIEGYEANLSLQYCDLRELDKWKW